MVSFSDLSPVNADCGIVMINACICLYGISFNMDCLISSSQQSREVLCISYVAAQYVSMTDFKQVNANSAPLSRTLQVSLGRKSE